LSLEQAIEFIADDEFVEITPKSIRLRKKVCKPTGAPAAGKKSAPAGNPVTFCSTATLLCSDELASQFAALHDDGPEASHQQFPLEILWRMTI